MHEVYLRLVDQRRIEWQNRGQFFGVASQTMRRILVDRARARKSVKRGAEFERVPLEDAIALAEESDALVLDLDESLNELRKFDELKSRIIELRFFGGLTVDETAVVLRVAPDTVMRDSRLAKAWLARELSRGAQRDA